MTIDEAIDISWGADRYRGVLRPDLAEALERIEHQLTTCGFNWLTGQAAHAVLREAISQSGPDQGTETGRNAQGMGPSV